MLIQGFLVVFLVEYELHDMDHSIFSAYCLQHPDSVHVRKPQIKIVVDIIYLLYKGIY